MQLVKKPITLRIDPELLEQIKRNAARDNRSVTNFIETALRQQLSGSRSRQAAASRGAPAPKS
jgi:hypothetical protein